MTVSFVRFHFEEMLLFTEEAPTSIPEREPGLLAADTEETAVFRLQDRRLLCTHICARSFEAVRRYSSAVLWPLDFLRIECSGFLFSLRSNHRSWDIHNISRHPLVVVRSVERLTLGRASMIVLIRV